MNGVQLVRRLKALPLTGPGDVQALAQQLPQPAPDDVLALLELCLGRNADAEQQLHRCSLLVVLVRQGPDRALFAPLVRALRHADPTLRGSLARAIPVVNDPGRHGELCELLRSPDHALRAAATRVLGQVGGKGAMDTLAAMARERGFEHRVTALDAALRVGGHRAVPALVEALPLCTPQERAQVVRLLGDRERMGANRGPALQALARLLEDPDEALAVSAVAAFAGMADEDQWFEHLPVALESRRPAVVRAAVASLGAFRSPRAIATLQSKLRTGNKAVRVVVLDTLEAIGTDAVLPALVDALSHKSLAVRSRATEVMGNLGAQGKVEVARSVMWLLRSPDPDVRRIAVDIARKAKDPNETLWPRLFALLRDQDWWVRERVADALVELAGRRLIPHLAGFLEDPDPPIRLFAVDVLTRMKATEALGALVRAAQKDTDWWVRERAMEAVATLGDARAAPYLVHIVLNEPKVRLGGLSALARLGAREVAPHLAPLLREDDPDVRLATLRALEVLGDASLAPLLQPLATDPRVEVRELARRLAAGWQLELAVASGDTIAGSPLDHLLVRTAEAHGDDLLLSPGRKPFLRRMNAVEPLTEDVLDDEAVRALVLPILNPTQLAALAAREDVDLSYEVASHRLRFRANVFHQMHGLAAVFRIIKGAIPSLSTLGLPPVVARLGRLKNGLVLIGGPTGSGKSTTLAALIDDINQTSARHVVTLEDPIEVVHGNRQGLVNQREVGTHTRSYPLALRATLREDPDVILVGELRDLDTIAFAVSAAETGHLVFGTVHTVSADTTLDRIINVFPAAQQDQVRSMLAGSLRAVCCQYLLTRAQGEGRVLACEVMLNNDAVANLIRTGKTFQLQSVIATQRAAGMQLMDGELLRLVRDGTVSAEVAWVKARDRREFETMLGGPPSDRGPLGGG